jgi:hypothetical protein
MQRVWLLLHRQGGLPLLLLVMLVLPLLLLLPAAALGCGL